jgi:hypothetical protein
MKAACKAKNPNEKVDEGPVNESRASRLSSGFKALGTSFKVSECVDRAKVFHSAVTISASEKDYQGTQKDYCDCPKKLKSY